MSLRHQNNIACGKTVSCATKTDKNDIPAAGFTGKKTILAFTSGLQECLLQHYLLLVDYGSPDYLIPRKYISDNDFSNNISVLKSARSERRQYR